MLYGFLLVCLYGFHAGGGFGSKVYDDANLLTGTEIMELERLSAELGAERETDFIILTVDDTEGKDVVKYTQDFYDEMAPGYDKPHGNTAIITLDMEHREVYLAGFKKQRHIWIMNGWI